MRNTFLYVLAVCAASFVAIHPSNLLAEGGSGTMSFELIGPDNTPEITGDWTLIRPGNERTEGDDSEFSFGELAAGNYTFTTTLPQGTSASIEVHRNGELSETIDHPQVSFSLADGDSLMLKVMYAYTRIGVVAVNSSPAGLHFSMKGPNDMKLEGVTPASFEQYPEGQYAVYFDQIEGCPDIPAQSDRLVNGSRITLQVEVVCDNLKETDLGRNDQKSLEFVSVNVDGQTVVLEDVRLGTWFAAYVHRVAKAGVIGGYKNRSGAYNGKFGPSDNVTVAQLSKIAHKIAGIDETKVRVPVQNTKAKNQWFEQYFASAEQQWWEVWRDKWVDPSRPAKRGEVVATILRALDVRVVWAQGKTFADVKPTHKYANAIETAAVDGIIDSGGNFRPDDPINRAEVAKMLSNAIDAYIEDTLELQGGSY